MPSSLIPEQSIIIHASLAATIGLEEAVLLSVLNESQKFLSPSPSRGYQWVDIDAPRLLELLPFWSAADIQRVSKSLCDKGVILIESAPFTQAQSLCFALNEKAQATASESDLADNRTFENQQQSQQSVAARSKDWRGANRISPYWQPSDEVLDKITRFHNVPRDFIEEQLSEFITYWRERNEVAHSWNAKFESHVKSLWRRRQSEPRFITEKGQPSSLANNWQPNEEIMQMLASAGINEVLIRDTIPGFVVYWRERGGVSATWNHQFFKHVKKQWDRYNAALRNEKEPTLISDQWQPDQSFYEVLTFTKIDKAFAAKQICEFVLYWTETGEMHRSWNSKFLQHVKYQWARQHQMGQLDAGHKNAHTKGQANHQGFIERHKDPSWRDGL